MSAFNDHLNYLAAREAESKAGLDWTYKQLTDAVGPLTVTRLGGGRKLGEYVRPDAAARKLFIENDPVGTRLQDKRPWALMVEPTSTRGQYVIRYTSPAGRIVADLDIDGVMRHIAIWAFDHGAKPNQE